MKNILLQKIQNYILITSSFVSRDHGLVWCNVFKASLLENSSIKIVKQNYLQKDFRGRNLWHKTLVFYSDEVFSRG
jgi:hypothetical protein